MGLYEVIEHINFSEYKDRVADKQKNIYFWHGS